MKRKIQHGYILLADISGFDGYITKVELEHAKGVIKELLELIVSGLTPPMVLASLEGDAVLTFVDERKVSQGETLIELIESTYTEFRDRLESIHRNNSCDCLACRDAPTLDLKFFLHYGEYSVQSVNGGGLELGGLDAKLVRERLLKDQVISINGRGGYVLFTEMGLERMGLEPHGMTTNCSSYPYLWEIRTARLDLQSRYQELITTRRTFVSADEADFSLTYDFNVPSDVLWKWLNDPEKRSQWMKWRTWSAGIRPWGRNVVGAKNHCAHGLGTLIETILGWSPHKTFTVEQRQDSIKFAMLQTFQLEPLANGKETRLCIHTSIQKAGSFWLPRRLLTLGIERLWKSDYKRLDQMIKEDDVSMDN